MRYDLIIIGGGPAGYLAAERAGHAGLKVAVAEERSLGGVCLNEGCIPTKTLLYSAKLYDGVKYGEKYGVKAEALSIDHAKEFLQGRAADGQGHHQADDDGAAGDNDR